MARTMTRQEFAALLHGPAYPALKKPLKPRQWQRLVREARRRGTTVQGLASGLPPALMPQTRRGIRRQAAETINTSYKPIEADLDSQEARINAITEKLPENAKPDPKITAQLEAVAKKNGFASYDEYNDVVANISMVLGGFDPATKKYVGSDAAIKAQIAQVQADKKMSPKDKKEALADLNEALKSPAPPIENKGNIDLVAKYYDNLADALGGDQQ